MNPNEKRFSNRNTQTACSAGDSTCAPASFVAPASRRLFASSATPLAHHFVCGDGDVANTLAVRRGAACGSRGSAIHPEIPLCGIEGLRQSLPRPHSLADRSATLPISAVGAPQLSPPRKRWEKTRAKREPKYFVGRSFSSDKKDGAKRLHFAVHFPRAFEFLLPHQDRYVISHAVASAVTLCDNEPFLQRASLTDKQWTGNEVRKTFLKFFAERPGFEHRVVRSSSLVPTNDPTLLFANAGMNQFKDVFLGLEKRDYNRAASSQKCVRAGGKHNDLENVGYTRRHHTFFEMLGNFSFGDYFKAEAIDYAWTLLTKDYALPKDKLYITVFREDDDAEELWQEVTGIPKDRIFRLDEKDNFWQMGETGPCGPCSEIHYDLGPEAAEKGREHEKFPEDGGGRFVEIWNLVFMQFDRDASGKMAPLPKPSIDTGMGLERTAAVMQGVISNYDTDLIRPIIHRAGELFGKIYGDDERADTVLRINADHARATAFLINDGVLPSNEGRGYVLREIMRRAMRNARMLGTVDPYLHKLTGFVAEHMSDAYPEMIESIPRVARVVKDEEHRYATTFMVAEKVFHDEARTAVSGVLPGASAFKLYDTYGLALDEQEEMAREFDLIIDREGFTAEMEKQRTRARASWKGAEKTQVDPIYQLLPRTEFIGRETLEAPAKIAAV